MKWDIAFFNRSVMQAIADWPLTLHAKALHIFELIELHGPLVIKMPLIKSLGGGLYEVRASGTEGIGRAIFCLSEYKEVMILHAFIKKTQKIPLKELRIAKARYRDVKNDR